MKVFTLYGDASVPGAEVTSVSHNEGPEVFGIAVGSQENGNKLGFVKLSENSPKVSVVNYAHIESGGKKPTITPLNSHDSKKSSCLVVFRTPVNKGGKNFHTGDRKEALCYKCEIEYEPKTDMCRSCGKELKIRYFQFPGQILAQGTVRNSKRPIFGDQLIAIIKKGEFFRTAYNGFHQTRKGTHYHLFDGVNLHTYTWFERVAKRAFF